MLETTSVTDPSPTTGLTPLDAGALAAQGKLHKEHVLHSWVDCQTFLTRTELATGRRQSHGPIASPTFDTQTISDTTTGSGITSRASCSLTVPQNSSLFSKKGEVRRSHFTRIFDLNAKNRKKSRNDESCEGRPYEATMNLWDTCADMHSAAMTESEWNMLNETWRMSLYIAGPIKKTKKRKES